MTNNGRWHQESAPNRHRQSNASQNEPKSHTKRFKIMMGMKKKKKKLTVSVKIRSKDVLEGREAEMKFKQSTISNNCPVVTYDSVFRS